MKAVKVISALLGLVFVVGTASFAAVNAPVEFKRDLSYHLSEGYVDILRDEQPIARYVYKDTSVPYIYPLNSLAGVSVTPDPNAEGLFAAGDSHRSFWLGFGDVNGIDFWNTGDDCGRIVQTSQKYDSFTGGYWNLHTTYNWTAPDGNIVLKEERRNSFLSSNYGLLVSTMTTFMSGAQEVKFGDTPEGFFALRVAPGIDLKTGKGRVVNSNGDKGVDCLGKRATWCDYTGEIDGKPVGITVFDVAANYGYPTYWNVTDYGLLAANPFGGKSLTNDPENESSYTMKPGQMMTFVYIVLVHDSKLSKSDLDSLAVQIAGGGQEPPPHSIDAQRLEEMRKENPNAAPDKAPLPRPSEQTRPADATK